MGNSWSAWVPVLVGSAIADVVAAFVVWRRRRSTGRKALCLALLAGMTWSLAYALELAAPSSASQQRWGNLKYVGTTILPAAWLIFTLQYAGRITDVRRGLLAALAVEPLVMLSLLAYPPTRTLVHSYPPGPPQPIPTPHHGVAYWLHFVYTNLLVLIGSTILLITMMRISRLYRRQSFTLLVVICLPLLANAMASLDVPPFQALDPTPVAITLAACVLVFGVLRYRLLDLRPVARTLVMETMHDAVFVIDPQGRVVDLNPAAQQLVGRKPATVVGCPLVELLGEQASAVDSAEPGSHDLQVDAGGGSRDLEVTVAPLQDPGGATAGRVLVLRDVSARRGLERDLRRLAYTDSLTGLPNRLLFYDRLDNALGMASRHRTPLAILLLDLDRFKSINDSLGHETGDRVLTTIARRLRNCLRAEDTIARLGGDEFAVLLPEISDPPDTRLVADKLLAALAAPQLINGHELTIDASIGVAVFPQDGEDARRLLGSADAAMYRAKSRGGGRVETFAAPLGRHAAHRRQLEAELRRGLRSRQLRLAFQPYFALASRTLVGYEALVRWNHPRRGLLAPAAFLQMAEDTGLITALDRWVLAEACRHAQHWASPLAVSVNISPARFKAGDLSEDVSGILTTTGLDPRRLTLELSERTLFDEDPDALTVLTDLVTAGVSLALDDFGAGYTSLGHLRLLPLTQLKIDQSLIALSDDQADGSAITAAVISFAHALGLTVTAEGIERPHQLTLLSGLGCEYGQGFLLGRPHPVPSPGDR